MASRSAIVQRGAFFMDPGELHRLAARAPTRERQAQELERQQYLKRWSDGEWAKARQAVAELESNVHKAASEGRFQTVVYKAHAQFQTGQFSPIVERVTETVKTGWFKTERREVVVIRYIPDYAQYVFDSCPRNSNPHWVGVDWHEWAPHECSRGAREIQLHVSW